MKIRCIARKAGWYNLQRHYPPSADNKRAGAEFIVEGQDFSMKWMRISPQSKFTLQQVLDFQKKWWEAKRKGMDPKLLDELGNKKNEAKLQREGVFKEPYVPAQDDGALKEEDPEEEGVTYASIQKEADKQAQKARPKTKENFPEGEVMILEEGNEKTSEVSGSGNKEVI